MNKSPLASSGTAASSADGPITVIAAVKDHRHQLDRQQVATSFVQQMVSDDESNIKQDQFFDVAGLATSTSSVIKQQSSATETPDIGILGKNFVQKNSSEQRIDNHFTVHRKKKLQATADVDVGILDKQLHDRQQHISNANLHVNNEVTRRSLQSYEALPFLCTAESGDTGSNYFKNLFNVTDGYFPTCYCPTPTTCGPKLCECLELDANGDFTKCIDPLNQLCDGTKYIDGIPGPWSMEECLGNKFFALRYCSWLPCFVDGGSYWECKCKYCDAWCTVYRDAQKCATSKCCQAQTNDEGRETCFEYDGWKNYYEEETSFSISYEEMVSTFNDCRFNHDGSGKSSIVQCYCESFSYKGCVNYGVSRPNLCEKMICCNEQTEDIGRLDCFARFRDDSWGSDLTGRDFHTMRDTIQESCVENSDRSSDQCKCDVLGLSNCLYGNVYQWEKLEPNCDLFQCCEAQITDGGRKDCLVLDEARLRYGRCINDGNTTESCICDKSNTLCSSGHSNDRHCELSSCCREQADDTGREACIGNFTTSQPSFAPSETTPEDSIDDTGASPTAASALPGTSSASIPTLFGAKSRNKVIAKILVVGWLLFT